MSKTSLRHRGQHPNDERLFGDKPQQKILREAVYDYSFLLTRGYSESSLPDLIGSRYRLTARQRKVVRRCGCSDQSFHERGRKELNPQNLKGCSTIIDGFNLIITLETAFSGGFVFEGRDGCYRDLSNIFGNYRKVYETQKSINLAGQLLQKYQVTEVTWVLDAPVSNSGRLGQVIRETAEAYGWNWQVVNTDQADARVLQSGCTVITSDAQILDKCQSWFNLSREVIQAYIPKVVSVSFTDL